MSQATIPLLEVDEAQITIMKAAHQIACAMPEAFIASSVGITLVL